ncbi:hypothetical protein DY240_15670 [Jiangella rhizosphaerae]|uniref:Uncharacterized protein n=1 Tax=Jiangella rhizosphaerae TaxID=2293569 RepID=A0A418KPK9_9ACTN|nr:hypothetical protein DY240_15670 [Jiangella rhizosphaerae]
MALMLRPESGRAPRGGEGRVMQDHDRAGTDAAVPSVADGWDTPEPKRCRYSGIWCYAKPLLELEVTPEAEPCCRHLLTDAEAVSR